MHALVQNNQIKTVSPLPRIWWDGNRWHDLRDDDGTRAAALGWLPVTVQPRPNDTETTTWDRAEPAIVNGLPAIGWTERPWTAAELQSRAEATVSTKLTDDSRSDLEKLNRAIAKQATLLGAATVPGSIRAILGTADTPGTTSLRALKAQTNTAVVTAQSIKALIGFVIDLALLVVTNTQQDRIVARQLMRLSKLAAGDLDSADVGTE